MVRFQNIPEQLKSCKFCCWKRVFRNGRMTKLPINPVTGKAASTNDPTTFGTFEQAKAVYERGRYDGIGILVDSIAAFDIDHCVQEDGGLNELAADVLAAFKDAYVEISPSGTGLRGFFTVRQDFAFDKSTSTSPLLYSNPVFPSETSSGVPPILAAIIGVPYVCDSITEKGQFS